jgi:hypothetical protein
MNERWTWVIRYLVVIGAALILAAVLGDMALFKTTKLGKSGISAARLVQFLGYGGALVVAWMLAKQVAEALPGDPRWNVVKSTLLPLTTLIAVAVGQSVLLRFLAPLMKRHWHQIYNWVSIGLIIVCAVWLLGALLTGSASLARRNPYP